MKTLLFFLFFSWSCMVVSDDYQSARRIGHCPIDLSQTYQAVMPVNTKKILSYDPDKDKPAVSISESSYNLIHASCAGAVSVIPHILTGYF